MTEVRDSGLRQRQTGALRLPEPSSLSFEGGRPFPHVVLDGVLDDATARSAVDAFPSPSWASWRRYSDAYQPGKLICSDLLAFPEPLKELVGLLNSPSTLEWLEELTGIAGLIPDPHLEGGGLHCTAGGGTLTPHTDFHLYPRLGVYRRLNVILYLNPDWREGDGGELELYDLPGKAPVAAVEPLLGRMVVFRTDDRSVHGFTNPVRDSTLRRSVATYYYTAQEAPQFSGDTNTYWRSHADGGPVHRARMTSYRGLLFGSRSLSWLAHRANPNLGRNVRAR